MSCELKIHIELLEDKKLSTQLRIAKPFEHGRSPGDDEYLSLIPILNELLIIENKLEFLRNIKKYSI